MGLSSQIVRLHERAGGSSQPWSGRNGSGRLHHLDFAYEPIAAARHRFYVARLFGRFSQDISQPLNRGIDAGVEFDHGLVRPKPEANLISHHDLAGVFQQ